MSHVEHKCRERESISGEMKTGENEINKMISSLYITKASLEFTINGEQSSRFEKRK